MAKAADVSGRLLRAKGASFGSLRRWSWDILPLLSPSTQACDCSFWLPPLAGEFGKTNIKGSVGRIENIWSEPVKVFQVPPNVCLWKLRYQKALHSHTAELYLVKGKQNDASSVTHMIPTPPTHTACPTQYFWNSNKSSSDLSFSISAFCTVEHKEGVSVHGKRCFDLLAGFFTEMHFLSQSVLFSAAQFLSHLSWCLIGFHWFTPSMMLAWPSLCWPCRKISAGLSNRHCSGYTAPPQYKQWMIVSVSWKWVKLPLLTAEP